MDVKEARRTINRIESAYPAMYPVSISLRNLGSGDDSDYGYCMISHRKNGPRFVIVINKQDPTRLQRFIILHEYAHALQWRPERQEAWRENHHDDEFGHHYARLIRLVGGVQE